MLYKFHKDNEFLESILQDGKLWFSNVADFNDPYEGIFRYRIKEPKDEDLKRFVEQENVGRPKLEIERRIKHYKENPLELQRRLNKPFVHISKNNGICCFAHAKNKRDILMWAHYTDSCKGVCLGFASTLKLYSSEGIVDGVLQGNASIIEKVNYVKNYPIRNPFDPNRHGAHQLLKTKFSIWEYENEYRSITPKKGLYTFQKTQLKEVIFGLKMPEVKRRNIAQIISQNTDLKHVKLFEIKLSRSRFRFRIVPYLIP
jgi:hypothetical protein